MMLLNENIKSLPLLLVGCGGIGCEAIKNLLLMGFNNIKMIDMDTIDVSNLNRQFLFNKSHINQSKAIVSANVAINLFANQQKKSQLNVVPIHGSITDEQYDVNFFKNFSFVINALDNIQARNHVNRMCLSADTPLIESGTEGYLGQTFVIKKDVTACYECSGPKTNQKTYASCTIRNTPSLPIHCIVWGKHLFNQLFGEVDEDNEVSPDMNDPELMNSNNKENQDKEQTEEETTKSPSTRKWAESNNYDATLLFDKLFRIDIEYLHKMDKLWKNRTKPIVLKYDQLDVELPNTSKNVEEKTIEESSCLEDQKILNLKECFDLFSTSLNELKKRLTTESNLIWDKDDEAALNFVTAVSNLRSFCFHIERKSKFDVKSMAGNIIPAISSTNSIIGGLMILQLINILKELDKLTSEQKLDKQQINQLFKKQCKQIFLRKVSLNINNLIASYECFEQNPNCMVCCTGHIPELEVKFNFNEVTLSEFVDQFILKKLNFVCPDIQLDGQPNIIWSKDDDYSEKENEEFKTKPLIDYLWMKNNLRLKIYDLLQEMTVIVTLIDEKFNLNDNDGIFYKMNIINHGLLKNENEIEEEDDQPTTSIKSLNNESIENTNTINNNLLKRQQTIDLENETTIEFKSTDNIELINGNDQQNGNNEIILIDSDDDINEIELNSNGDSKIKNNKVNEMSNDSVCEILDDDDDLELIEEDSDIKEINEKRKLNEIESSLEDERSNKKLRIENI